VAEDTPSSLKDLRDSVYTIMRDVYKAVINDLKRIRYMVGLWETSM
jgi:hypothetical protein